MPDVKRVVPMFNFTSNVVTADWIPLAQLLGDPSLSLFITHGGISSMMEAVGHAVPILGIPLQGDQFYNLGRLVERGMADMISVEELTVKRLSDKLSNLLGEAVDLSDSTPPLQSSRGQQQRYSFSSITAFGERSDAEVNNYLSSHDRELMQSSVKHMA
ncbi:unnamed protein product [Soboliphyme baturini]|uniref:UDP-glucuronosyltransferase n=1 Tax=Soboliphyme baturini TaxID=241478 RepID=A0A183IN84_9BILA|nr:unnamed protein product [Soboliphyme baturini]